MVSRTAILLSLCAATISAQAQVADEAAIIDDDRGRHLQQSAAEDEEVVYDILTGEPIIPSSSSSSSSSNESPVSAPTSTTNTAVVDGGKISGTVYNDINGNGQRDETSSSSQEETPVSGTIVDLYNCHTGAQERYTTTDNNGFYSFSISGTNLPEDTTLKNCYYIQFTVLDDTDDTNNMMDDVMSPMTVFTTPQNGETLDIYLGRGETIPNVDAGIMQELWNNGSDTSFADEEEEWNNSYFPTFTPSVSMGVEMEAGGAESGVESSWFPTPSPTRMLGQEETVSVYDEEKEDTTASEVVETFDDESTTTANDEQANTENMITLRSSVRLLLSNVDTRMKRNALTLFESVCASFLNSQIVEYSTEASIPLYDLNCNVLRQEIVEDERVRQVRRRALRLGRSLAETKETESVNDSSSSNGDSRLVARVRVIGHTDKSSSIQDASDVNFRSVLMQFFNEQGLQFTDALKEESAALVESSTSSSYAEASTTAEYFDAVGSVSCVTSSQVHSSGSASEAQTSNEGNNNDGGGNNKGLVAAIVVCMVVGSLIFVGLIILTRRQRKREQQIGQSTGSDADTADGMNNAVVVGDGGRGSGSPGGGMSLFKSFPSMPRFRTDSPPCTPPSNITAASSFSPNSMCSYVCSDGEVEIIEDGLGLEQLEYHPNALIRRDVMAPPGKLGLLVTGGGGRNAIGYDGPLVHVIQPGSPMEGLIHVEDRIVAINDIDTREFTAEELIQVMEDTSGSERKLTVLSD
ncbi:hypothetical protein ACHAXH_001816 [Discostella pseudostelligera]